MMTLLIDTKSKSSMSVIIIIVIIAITVLQAVYYYKTQNIRINFTSWLLVLTSMMPRRSEYRSMVFTMISEGMCVCGRRGYMSLHDKWQTVDPRIMNILSFISFLFGNRSKQFAKRYYLHIKTSLRTVK